MPEFTSPPTPFDMPEYEWFKNAPYGDILFDLPRLYEQLESGNVSDEYRVQVALLAADQAQGTSMYQHVIAWFGSSIGIVLNAYASQVEKTNEESGATFKLSDDSYVKNFTKDGAEPFGSIVGFATTSDRIFESFNKHIRDNTQPIPIQKWECRIGGSKFLVPPTNIKIQNIYKTGSLTGGVIREQTTAKFNSGHSETIIDMRLYFPNQDEVWGIGPKNELNINFDTAPDGIIDRFMGSLRGLITQFRYAPFLPIRHHLLNSVYDITGVTMNNLSVSTIPDFPLCFVVDLRMKAFNHKVFLEPIQDFNQAIHWGKYRQYIGRAAQRMSHDISRGFLVEVDKSEENEGTSAEGQRVYEYEGTGITVFNRQRELLAGKHLELYYPRSTPGRVFTPDMSNFRQPGENLIIGRDKAAWESFLGNLGVDVNVNPQAVYEYVNNTSSNLTSGDFNARTAMLEFLRNLNIQSAAGMSNDKLEEFIQLAIDEYRQKNPNAEITDALIESITNGTKGLWYAYMFNSWKNMPYFQAYADAAERADNNRPINEWEIPMDRFEIDTNKVVLEGISVNLTNNFASLQLQMQENPTYQHIGGGDSTMTFQMKVIGEEALHGFKRVLKHINGLARLENTRGVLGFVGIKNLLTALCGIKYALPLDFTTEIVEDTPGTYMVTLTFTDFDIFQQRREELSIQQQQELIEHFSKRNPFLRIKQMWGVFNAYPDFPLSVKDEDGNVVGHLDPDYYFRAFQTIDDDIVTWNNTNTRPTFKDVSSHAARGERWLDRPDSGHVTEESPEQGSSALDNTLGGRLTNYEHKVEYYTGYRNEDGSQHNVIEIGRDGISLGAANHETGEIVPSKENVKFREDAAAYKQHTPMFEGLTPGSHQTPMLTENPLDQFELMMTDAQYRDVSGRMVRAFPTYMLWIIDEGGTFAGVKLFDNFYNMRSVIDFSLVSSEDILGDTLVLRLSNLYSKLTTRYQGKLHTNEKQAQELSEAGLDVLMSIDNYMVEGFGDDEALAGPDGDGLFYLLGNTYRNIISGTTDSLVQIDRIRLKPGVRVHLRAGYSANPNNLETVFNGTITDVQQGDIVTVTAQSDAIELSPLVNTTNESGHSGKIDGSLMTDSDGLALWLSEPRDLMIRLLTMGSSTFKEAIAYASDNMIFSENKFGIRHFGTMLFEPLSQREQEKIDLKNEGVLEQASRFFPESDSSSVGGQLSGTGFGFDALSGLIGVRAGAAQIMAQLWANLNRDPDYEIFKRNIYPGNGYGVGQFLGGDFSDGGLAIALAAASGENVDFQSGSNQNTEGSLYNRSIAQRILAAGGDTQLQGAIDNVGLPEEDDGDDGGGFSWWGAASSVLFPLQDLWPSAWETGAIATGALFGSGGQMFMFGLDAALMTAEKVTDLFGYGDGDSDSPFRRILGISQGLDDDGEFDEVSFRAQTYMKSVWDLFQLCAALLPNYIVAVRPFEGRSTVFYGKPHWLYTSGVIPITTGIPKDHEAAQIVQPTDLQELLQQHAEQASPFKDLEEQLGIVNKLAEPNAGGNPDPRAGVGSGVPGDVGNLDPDGDGILTIDEVAALCYHVGQWQDEVNLAKAIACCWAESSFKIANHNPARGGQGAMGLWQIRATLHAARLRGRPAEDLLRDPVFNTEIARELYQERVQNGTNGWGPWDESMNPPSRAFNEKWPEAQQVARRFIANPVPAGGSGGGQPLGDRLNPFHKSSVDKMSKWLGNNGGSDPADEMDDWGDILPPEMEQAFSIVADAAKDIVVHEEPNTLEQKDLYWYYLDSDIDKEKFPNPILYEMIRGYAEISIPFWIDPEFGLYTPGASTNTGDIARMLFDKEYNDSFWETNDDGEVVPKQIEDENGNMVDRISITTGEAPPPLLVESGKTLDMAEEIWKDFRKYWRGMEVMQDAYEATHPGIRPKKVDGLYQPRDYVIMGNQFVSMLWNSPLARAWVVIVANRKIDHSQVPTAGGVVDSITDFASRTPVVGGLFKKGGDTAETIVRVTGSGPLGGEDGWIDVPLLDPKGSQWTFELVGQLFAHFWDESGGSANNLEKTELGIFKLTDRMESFIRQNMTPGRIDDNVLDKALDALGDMVDRNIGALITAVGSTIQGIIQLYRQSMMALGYGLNMAGQMQKQANILNKFYNDSIYYDSSPEGNPIDSLEYLADNPFTREFAEPVVEVREPFQRVHFIDSFHHILHNGIQETLNEVPTTITAVSDGSHPVTVQFDKGIPSNLQTERVVETGLFWDNAKGKGFFSALHPLLHPVETARGYIKTAMGSSDELMSKRVGLYHLKEGLKDIYTGEILIVGDADIRPHDLLYISDAYEKIHGLVEVEQVVHHFTPEMGFITSVTPNALVTINDPSRWTMLSWIWSWWSVKEFRDTVRSKLHTVADASSTIGGVGITMEELAVGMDDSWRGHLQYTQGASALIKDLMGAKAVGLLGYESVRSESSQAEDLTRANTDVISGITNTFTLGLTGAMEDWAWDAFDWVRDNLIDQQGCYIQYLNKNGEAMDAGLSYAQGVAVGRHHKTTLLPGILGISVETVKDGNTRITTDDLLAELGYNEIDISQFRKYTSYWQDQVNSEVLRLAGQSPGEDITEMPDVVIGTVSLEDGVIDGDTIHVKVQGESGVTKVRFAGVSAPELHFKGDLLEANSPDNRGRLATEYLMELLKNEGSDPVVAVRISNREKEDQYGRKLGVIFWHTPSNVPPEKRADVLRRYATSWPPIPWDSYMEDGAPYTLNWAMVLSGFASVDTLGLYFGEDYGGINES